MLSSHTIKLRHFTNGPHPETIGAGTTPQSFIGKASMATEKHTTVVPFPASLSEFLARSFYVLNAQGDDLVVVRTGLDYYNGEEVMLMASKESNGMIYFHDDARSVDIMREGDNTDIETPKFADQLSRMAALHGSHYDPVSHQISVRTHRSTVADKVQRLIKAAQHIAETNNKIL
jgi:hypothetical protein